MLNTQFFGREDELQEVGELLRAHRLVTIVGPGGCGKTRLALEAGRAASSRLDDGAAFVALDQLGSAEAVATLVAHANGASDVDGMDGLVSILDSKTRLLVLDNCEHILPESAELVAQLLRRCPGLTILATSREPLPLTAGRTFILEPFTDGAEAAEAIFADRASAAGRAPSPTESESVRALCSVLDGLPLAIELAAGLAVSVSPTELVRLSDQRLHLLRSSDADRPERHQSLRSTIEWSYGLLPEAEMLLFERLALFRGCFTVDAVEGQRDSTDGELRDSTAMLTLARLVRRSLVQVQSVEDRRSFRLLESIRLFAYERLEMRSGALESAREALIHRAVAVTSLAATNLTGPKQESWMRVLDAERDVLRDGLREAMASQRGSAALEIAGSLHRYWYSRSAIREGLDWLRRALRIGKEASPAVRARALYGAGLLSRQRGSYDEAADYFSDHLALQRELGDALAVARAYNSLAGALHAAGQAGPASEMLKESLQAWQTAGDERGLASALANLGVIACDSGDYDEALRLGREALDIRVRLRHEEGIAVSLENLATASLRSGDWRQARELFTNSTRRYVTLDEPDGVATCLEGLAAIAATQGEHVRGITLYAAAEALRVKIDVPATPADAAFHQAVQLGLSHRVDFEQLKTEGAALALSEAVALAVLDPPNRRIQLSAREHEIQRLLVRGDSNKEIASALRLSPRTVNGHLTNIYRKLGVRGRTEAVAKLLGGV
jgi:non-specific serine/threonine protein kinase